MLRRRFPSAFIMATDAAPDMLVQARRAQTERTELVQQNADGTDSAAEQVLGQAPYDLIASSALLQWLPDLGAHLRFVAGLARPAGRYAFSAFTRTNLPELNALLAAPPFEYRTFPGIEPRTLESVAGSSGWALRRLEECEEREALPSPLAVLQHLRAMGASRDPREGGRLTRSTLRQLLNSYAERHAVTGGVSLTWRSCLAVLERVP
jgi:SAM-dependent methyltransferase